MDASPAPRILTKRFVFSLIILANGVALKWYGKLGDEAYVILNIAVILGHNAAALVGAWKNK